jgi:hypothetical protein
MRLKIPTSISEITLRQYQEYVKITEVNESSSTFLKQKVVSHFCNVDMTNVQRIGWKDIEEIYKVITDMFEAKNIKFEQRFTFKGEEFGFIPDFENMTSGEYMDLSLYVADWHSMHKAMAVLFRPIIARKGSQYLIKDYGGSEEYSNMMYDLPLDKVMGAVFFLTDSYRQLSQDILQYLQEEALSNQELRASLLRSGGGITRFTSALEGISSTLMPSLKLK